MKTNNIYSIITLIIVVCLTSLGIQAAPPEYDLPVVVNNDATNPVPVTIANPVSVRTGGVYRYVGTTVAETLPNIGLNGMNNVCRAEFGNEARMCSTKEFFLTPDTSSTPQGTAHIRPVQTSTVWQSVGEDILEGRAQYAEWTGLTRLGRTWPISMCGGWNSSASQNTLSVLVTDADGVQLFRSNHNNIDYSCADERSVTCCTPQ